MPAASLSSVEGHSQARLSGCSLGPRHQHRWEEATGRAPRLQELSGVSTREEHLPAGGTGPGAVGQPPEPGRQLPQGSKPAHWGCAHTAACSGPGPRPTGPPARPHASLGAQAKEWRWLAGGAAGGSESQAAVRPVPSPLQCPGSAGWPPCRRASVHRLPRGPGWATRVVLLACGATLPGPAPASTRTGDRRPPPGLLFPPGTPQGLLSGPSSRSQGRGPTAAPRPLRPLLRGASWEATTRVPWGEPACDAWTSEHFRRGHSCRPRLSRRTGSGQSQHFNEQGVGQQLPRPSSGSRLGQLDRPACRRPVCSVRVS